MTLQEQITQLTADLAECRKWLKEANLKFDDSDFRVSELLKQNRLLAADIEKYRQLLNYFASGINLMPWGKIKAYLPTEVARTLTELNYQVDAILSTPNPGAEILNELKLSDQKWRQLLWLRHGCDLTSLYGDDGEMQCNHCVIDFKRDSFDDIMYKFEKINNAREGKENV